MAENQLSWHKALKAAAIVGPLVVIFLWMGSFAFQTKTGSKVELKIVGFDPRDLLSGHFLRYRVDYGGPVHCRSPGTKCICLEADRSGIAKIIDQGSCPQLSGCELLLKGQCKQNRFDAGLERFYFPERHRKKLRTAPEDSTIIVKLSAKGGAVVTDLRVNGVPLKQWLIDN